MVLVLAILGAIPALYGMWVFIDKYITKTPAQKAVEFDGDLNDALKKAEDKKNPDPTDLSKLINRL